MVISSELTRHNLTFSKERIQLRTIEMLESPINAIANTTPFITYLISNCWFYAPLNFIDSEWNKIEKDIQVKLSHILHVNRLHTPNIVIR